MNVMWCEVKFPFGKKKSERGMFHASVHELMKALGDKYEVITIETRLDTCFVRRKPRGVSVVILRGSIRIGCLVGYMVGVSLT